MEDKIKRVSEKEPIPESLSPENMLKKLKIKEAELKAEKPVPVWKKFITSGKVWRRGGLAIACVLVIVLGLSVMMNGVGISKGEMGSKSESKGTNSEELKELEEVIPSVGSYEEVYKEIQRIRKEQRRNQYNGFLLGGGSKGEAGADSAAPETSVETYKGSVTNESESVADDSTTNSNSHSTTNLQEEGVGEADRVMTDGKYMYILKEDDKLAILEVNGTQMEKKSEIDVSPAEVEDKGKINFDVHEFYVKGDSLYLIAEESQYNEYYRLGGINTSVYTYDISNRANPVEKGHLVQSGYYESSRLVEDYLYVFTDYGVGDEIAKEEPDSYIPCADGEVVAYEDICIPENVDKDQYKLITSMKLDDPTKYVQEKAVLCGNGLVYVSQNAIYFASYDYNDKESEYTQTELWKFAYKDGQIIGSAMGKVKGSIRDQFAISENNGYLRVVTTYEKRNKGIVEELQDTVSGLFAEVDTAIIDPEGQSNGLFVLDTNLNQVGAVENLAPGEQVYSARFFANTAYFVTFRQTDPLFSVDLSDPANPKVLGELKIPGFSEYLHPYGDGLLLGLGYDADENGRQTGIKLTMFDVKDPSNVKELHTKVLVNFDNSSTSSSIWANCEAMYDHKKVLVDVSKNLIGFAMEVNSEEYSGNGDYQWREHNQYVVYGYDAENGFYEKMQDGYLTTNYYSFENGELRGAFIDHYFYVINRKMKIRCYDMDNDFVKVGECEF